MQDFENDIEQCLQVLRNGGIILYPTDTVWGIGCDATDPEAVEKVYQLKNRTDNKAMIVLVADEKDIIKYVAHPDMKVFDYLQQTSKPTTVVYEGALGLADNLTGNDGSIAIRICYDTFCRHLIKRFRKPLVSTSANISGEKTPLIFNDITADILDAVDYVVKYRQEDERIAEPSAVIKWNKDATVTILRS
ncbi:MAG: L-threonylcarbamoyladenylate synthase [Bacteroidota bacterium]